MYKRVGIAEMNLYLKDYDLPQYIFCSTDELACTEERPSRSSRSWRFWDRDFAFQSIISIAGAVRNSP